MKHPIKNFIHWIACNIKAGPIISENFGNTENVKHGIDYGFHRYVGAKPPRIQKHNYKFTIYSLDDILSSSFNIMKKKLLKSIEGHALQEGTIIGSFKR